MATFTALSRQHLLQGCRASAVFRCQAHKQKTETNKPQNRPAAENVGRDLIILFIAKIAMRKHCLKCNHQIHLAANWLLAPAAKRRTALLGGAAAYYILSQSSCRAAEAEYKPAQIRLDLAPDQSKYNPADDDLRDAAGKLQLALNAENVKVLPLLLPAMGACGCSAYCLHVLK